MLKEEIVKLKKEIEGLLAEPVTDIAKAREITGKQEIINSKLYLIHSLAQLEELETHLPEGQIDSIGT